MDRACKRYSFFSYMYIGDSELKLTFSSGTGYASDNMDWMEYNIFSAPESFGSVSVHNNVVLGVIWDSGISSQVMRSVAYIILTSNLQPVFY